MNLSALCQGCGRKGDVHHYDIRKAPWCRCKGAYGPYVAPPGHVTRFIFESKEDAAKREQGRLLGNAERLARDNFCSRWVKCGSGYRELPRTSPKRKALEKAYQEALRALEAFQATCSHPTRSPFDATMCDVCKARVE